MRIIIYNRIDIFERLVETMTCVLRTLCHNTSADSFYFIFDRTEIKQIRIINEYIYLMQKALKDHLIEDLKNM